jgi:glycosyltransferase involved in cell wall biosynthesis
VNYLFLHQNYPGQYLHIVRHLVESGGNQIVFISEPNANAIPGVRRVSYQIPKYDPDAVFPNVRDLDRGLRRAEQVADCAANLRALGFRPDIIIGHHGWGELLNLPDIWPDVPILGYFEFYYSPQGQDVGFDPEFPTSDKLSARVRAMNAINLLALALDQHGQTPTQWQYTRYPEWARRQIRVLPEGARLDLCKPNPAERGEELAIGKFSVAPDEKLVTYVVRNLEPYRGFHIMMRALVPLLAARSDVKVVLVGGDDVSYGSRLAGGTWREFMLKELAGKYDTSRVLMPGQVPYDTFLRLLQRSDAHAYLTYPFVPSWSLREALACGCVVIGSDVEPVAEFIADGRNGLLTPPLDPRRLAERLLEVLEDERLAKRLRAGARRFAERHLDMAAHIAAYESTIAELTGTARPAKRRAAGG